MYKCHIKKVYLHCNFIFHIGLAASQQEASKLCQCQCHTGGVSTTCNTPRVGQSESGTPVKTLPYNPGTLSLTPSSIDASTGQGKIKCITAGQAEIKGVTFNQGESASGQAEINNQSDNKASEQNIAINLDPDLEDFKDHDSDQKDVKAPICCDNNSNLGGNNQIINNSSTIIKSECYGRSENSKKVVGRSTVDCGDDDDFKPPKKKYRIVGVCYMQTVMCVV